MAVCKHCGTEIEDGLDYCPNCGQKVEFDYGDFFEPDEGLEEEAYNIFDTPEEFDMDSLLNKDFTEASAAKSAAELPDIAEEETTGDSGELDLAELLGLSEDDISEEVEDFSAPEPEELTMEDFGLGLTGVAEEEISPLEEAGESDFFALDELFQDLDADASKEQTEEAEVLDHGLEELLAASAATEEKTEKKKKEKKTKKEKKSFFQTVFGNVPVDPSKKKPEPTPEEIAAKKQKEAEEKKAKAEEKKLAAEEKKLASKRSKEEKARQKALAKEEKKAKKLEEAKQILEEMKETRINRLGATIVFVFFAVLAIVLLSGSDLFGYAVSITNAEQSFNKALNNNVKYYTDAYNEIYGLEIKPEDQVLNDKIMTVMIVNKELNSYNSYMVMEDYRAALHSLLQGLYRYGKYYEEAIPLGIDKDLDYVRTQILKELKNTFGVSEDEAELLRSMLEAAGAGKVNASVDTEAAKAYNLKLYEIVQASGLLENKAEEQE